MISLGGATEGTHTVHDPDLDKNRKIYISDRANSRIQVFSTVDGGFVRRWGTEGSGNDQMSHPTGIALDSDDNVYVTDSGGRLFALGRWGLLVNAGAVLYGLAMDYQVFLVSSMREAHIHGQAARQSVVHGFDQASRVVVLAVHNAPYVRRSLTYSLPAQRAAGFSPAVFGCLSANGRVKKTAGLKPAAAQAGGVRSCRGPNPKGLAAPV